jgi:hypothetical protein
MLLLSDQPLSEIALVLFTSFNVLLSEVVNTVPLVLLATFTHENVLKFALVRFTPSAEFCTVVLIN